MEWLLVALAAIILYLMGRSLAMADRRGTRGGFTPVLMFGGIFALIVWLATRM